MPASHAVTAIGDITLPKVTAGSNLTVTATSGGIAQSSTVTADGATALTAVVTSSVSSPSASYISLKSHWRPSSRTTQRRSLLIAATGV